MFVTIREYGTSTEAVSGDHCMVHAVVINPVDTPPPSPPPPTIDNSSTGGTNTNSDDASTVPHKRPRLSQSDKVGGGHGAITYIFRTAEIQGKFLVEKAKELGIPAGPVYGRLKAGESVTLPDGRTIDPCKLNQETTTITVGDIPLTPCPCRDSPSRWPFNPWFYDGRGRLPQSRLFTKSP